jgi:aryl-alcohol dehydrogenase-like predicted oxidoreductase
MGQFGAMYKARYWREHAFETVEKLLALSKESGEPLPTLAIAWVMANPAITSVILGASRTEQLKDTLAAADYSLVPELKTQLDDLTAEYRRGDAGR